MECLAISAEEEDQTCPGDGGLEYMLGDDREGAHAAPRSRRRSTTVVSSSGEDSDKEVAEEETSTPHGEAGSVATSRSVGVPR